LHELHDRAIEGQRENKLREKLIAAERENQWKEKKKKDIHTPNKLKFELLNLFIERKRM